MRFDRPVFFVKDGASELDPETGDYKDSDPVRTERIASVTDTTEQTMTLVYGKIRQGSLTVRIQNHYSDAFDRIEIAGKPYAVDYTRRLRHMQTFVVSEVQHEG